VSIEHGPARQRRRVRKAAEPLARIAFTVNEWCGITGLSRPTVYRQMQSGALRYVQFGRTRRIPAEEQQRLGFVTA
jgi:excisionase family DNA binding protein